MDESIKKALSESKYLIVICSPDAVESSWVNEEIKFFKSLGRENYIIPYIAKERHNANDFSKELYPSELRIIDKDILGISYSGKKGKQLSYLKVIACLLQIDLIELTKLDIDVEKKRKRLLWGVVILVLSLILGLIIALYRARNDSFEKEIDKVSLSIDVALRNGDLRLSQSLLLDLWDDYNSRISEKEKNKIERAIRKVAEYEQLYSIIKLGSSFNGILKINYSVNDDTLFVYESAGYHEYIQSKWKVSNGSLLSKIRVPGKLNNNDSIIIGENYDVGLIPDNTILVKNKLSKDTMSLSIPQGIKCMTLDNTHNTLYICVNDYRNTIGQWNLTTNQYNVLGSLDNMSNCIKLAMCKHDFLLLTAMSQEGIGIYDIAKNNFIGSYNFNSITDICVSKSSYDVAVSSSQNVYIIDTREHNSYFQISGENEMIYHLDVDMSIDGQLMLIKSIKYADTRKQNVEIWDTKSRTKIKEIDFNKINEDDYHKMIVRFSNSSNMIICSNSIVKLYDWKNDIVEKQVQIPDSFVTNLQFVNNRKNVLFDNYYLDTEKMSVLDSLPYKSSLSSDSKVFAELFTPISLLSPLYNINKTSINEKQSINVYETKTHDLISNWDVEYRVSNISMSKDGNTIGGISDDLLLIWDTKTGKIISRKVYQSTFNDISTFGQYFVLSGNNNFFLVDSKYGEIIYEPAFPLGNDIICSLCNDKFIVWIDGRQWKKSLSSVGVIKFDDLLSIINRWKTELGGQKIEEREMFF